MPSRLETMLIPILWRLIRRMTREEIISIPELAALELVDIKRFFPLDKFFIFGHGRSGTALLGRLIQTHPDVHCNWTGHFFTHSPTLIEIFRDPTIMAKFHDPNFRWNEGQDSRTIFLRATIDFFLEKNAYKLGKNIVGDKSPNTYANGQAIRYMNAIYPDGKLIYILRDGRDVLISQRFRQFIEFPHRLPRVDQKIREEYVLDPAPFFGKKKSLFTNHDMLRRSKIWERNVRESTRAGRELLGNRFLTLRFEDLLTQPIEEMKSVWSFLGADPTGLEQQICDEMNTNPVAEWQAQKNVDQLKTLSKGKKGSWRELFTENDRQVFKQIAGDQLIEFGYEKDYTW